MPLQEITSAQASALTKLKTALKPGVKDFACKGVVSPKRLDIRDLLLYFQSPNGDLSTLQFPLPDSEGESIIKNLLDAAVPSGFGRGQEDIFDPEYRLAKEIKPPRFATSPDLLSSSGILSILNEQMLPGVALSVKHNKINVYGKGGFFKAHRDTPKSPDHVGTITFCLPSRFTGGELVIRHAGETLTCSWGEDVLTEEGPKATWAFLFSDCEHEVLPVLSGNRITIAFDVYVDSAAKADLPSLSQFEHRQALISDALRVAMQAESIASAGLYLGLALSHDYPKDVLASCIHGPPVAMLKGVDALVVKAIEKEGYKWEFVAVHDPECFEWCGRKTKGEFSERLTVSDSVHTWEGEYVDDCGGPASACRSKRIIWVAPPRKYPVASNFIEYGNEPCLGTMYSTWAIKVRIPGTTELEEREVDSYDPEECYW